MSKYLMLTAAALFMGATIVGCHASGDIHPDNSAAISVAR
jgi:hypothetical protein